MASQRTTREIERDLAVTRDRIEARARALRERLEPSQVAADVLDRVRSSGAREFLDNLGRDVRDNPLPVAWTGLGLAWLARSCSQRSRSYGYDDLRDEDVGDDGPGLKERLGSVAHEAADTLRSGKESLRSGVESLRSGAESFRSGARDVGRRARGAGRSVARGGERFKNRLFDGTERVQDGFGRLVEEQPLLVGLFGLAIGAAVGALLPSTRREDEWMGAASDELKERAAERGRRAAEKAREAVESRAKEHASNGGPSRSSSGSQPDGGASDPRTGIGGTFAGPNPPPSGPIRTEPTN